MEIYQQEYLGDGVYIRKWHSDMSYILTTDDGVAVDNTIFLEPEVVKALIEYIEKNKT